MKKAGITVGIILVLALGWYLFLKPQDYRVSFKAKALPGTINQTLRAWNQIMDGSAPITFLDDGRFEQQLMFNDSVYRYTWNVTPIHDSLSQVDVDIKDLDNSIMNRIKLPFYDTDFETRSKNTLLDFNEFLIDHLDDFKITVIGEEELFSTYCACVAEKKLQREKASGMMRNYSLLNSIIAENEIELNGPPLIEVLDWNEKTDSLSYNFCYPIIRSERLQKHPEVFYKRLFGKNAIKAVYNGNYLTSDRAWYALLAYAEQNDLEVDPKPVEVFFNNPNMGGDELMWKTDVYLPIKSSSE
ncbi:GyrI-like domain-containing protein [Flagellimonas flava]|uniref:Effector-binding domain-containing protein n=1 Tax=Flagellimonas flava TaxID=570519 RepID=A0A1M5KBI6_9FLAO|nr:GyrI-like domain-containing protein [Allomuricauda flava]SHG49980.1 effector-binding domain-containing protein [Allomuricauda flava]